MFSGSAFVSLDPMAAVEKNAAGRSRQRNKVFACTKFPPCAMAFTRYEHLARHIRKHTGERPFACEHCPKKFSRLDNLRQHVQTVHSKLVAEEQQQAQQAQQQAQQQQQQQQQLQHQAQQVPLQQFSPVTYSRHTHSSHPYEYQYPYYKHPQVPASAPLPPPPPRNSLLGVERQPLQEFRPQTIKPLPLSLSNAGNEDPLASPATSSSYDVSYQTIIPTPTTASTQGSYGYYKSPLSSSFSQANSPYALNFNLPPSQQSQQQQQRSYSPILSTSGYQYKQQPQQQQQQQAQMSMQIPLQSVSYGNATSATNNVEDLYSPLRLRNYQQPTTYSYPYPGQQQQLQVQQQQQQPSSNSGSLSSPVMHNLSSQGDIYQYGSFPRPNFNTSSTATISSVSNVANHQQQQVGGSPDTSVGASTIVGGGGATVAVGPNDSDDTIRPGPTITSLVNDSTAAVNNTSNDSNHSGTNDTSSSTNVTGSTGSLSGNGSGSISSVPTSTSEYAGINMNLTGADKVNIYAPDSLQEAADGTENGGNANSNTSATNNASDWPAGTVQDVVVQSHLEVVQDSR